MTEPKTIPTRRISFEESLGTLPKYFAADGDLVTSHIVAMLSAVFPDGEDFFVRSVRNFRSDITDPALKKQVGGFIGQEAVHGREHRQFNARLAEHGYPTHQVERMVAASLRLREKLASKKANLAVTAALEHFTATLAETILSNPDARNTMEHPEMRNLFCWHALEESEHKAVAFDVYRHVGGSERLRTITMTVTTYGFLLGMTLTTIASLVRDRRAWNPIRLGKSLNKLRSSPFLTRELWRTLRAYNRPGFHPDDFDTAALEAEWRERLFGDAGELNDHLINAKAA